LAVTVIRSFDSFVKYRFFEPVYVFFEVLSQVFFGAVQRDISWEWRCQFAAFGLLSIAVNVNTQPVLGHIMGCLIASLAVVVVSHDFGPVFTTA
jgi:hypothetical protein